MSIFGYLESTKNKQKKQMENKTIDKNENTIAQTTETSKKVIDPNLEFQMLNGMEYKDPNTKHKITTSDVQNKKIAPDEKQKGIVKIFPPYKRLVNKKLTIVLMENTTKVAKQKEKVLQIANNIMKTDLICFINYCDTVEISEIGNNNLDISYVKVLGDKACLFDALIEAEKLVSSKYLTIEEKETERVCIDSIEIIGIGTCTDNASKASKEDALSSFFEISRKQKVATKYYCLTDEYFLNAAEIGFRSIGSILRNYQ